MSQNQTGLSNPPPGPVIASGGLLGLQGIGVLILAIVVLVSGLLDHVSVGQLVAQAVYYVVFALLMILVGINLVRGRRWARTPTIVLQLILVAIGVWLAGDSDRPVPGALVIALAVITGGLLFTPRGMQWLRRFPSMFGPENDH